MDKKACQFAPCKDCPHYNIVGGCPFDNGGGVEAMSLNQELHEALGYCWHGLVSINENGDLVCSCGRGFYTEANFDYHIKECNPHYVADPRLVIREMMKKGLLKRFLSSIGTTTNLDALGKMSSLIAIDTTGQLAQLALDWLREQRG